MDLETKISKFFFLSKKMFTLHQLERIFSVSESEKEGFQLALNNLVDKRIILEKNERYFSDYEKDDLTKKVEDFFTVNKKIYPLQKLEKIFNIDNFNRVKFYNCLNELEMQGKIICINDKEFVHIPDDSCLKSGSLMESNQGNYYIKTNDGIITIEDIGTARVSDIVFVLEDVDRRAHPKRGYGRIIRVVKPISSPKNKEFLTNGIINRDTKADGYFIEKDLVKIPISKKNLNGAFPKDLANVLISYDKSNKPFGKVVDILERRGSHVFIYKKGNWLPLGTENFKVILDSKEDYQENDKIIAEVSTHKVNGAYTLKVLEKINSASETPRDKIKLFAIDRGLSFDFDAKVLEEAQNISKEISEEELSKRLDLRNLETFTIDSSLAKDLDDAVSLEKTKNGYRLYVHIADVSYYVRPGTVLFDDYLKRGTSVYFGDMVIPELPPVISNGICSLNEGEDKLVKTLIMDFNEEGDLLDFSLHNSVINSNKKMAYDKVNDLLNGVNVDGSYLPFYNTLCNMRLLASKLEEQRIKRGSTSFSSLEYIYELDENGKPISISERNDGPAQKIIEHFMIVTNQVLAEYAYFLELPYIYRNHECPEFGKIKILNSKIKQISDKFQQKKNLDNPMVLQKYYNQICKNKSTTEIKYLSNIFLQAMPRAYYEDINRGHYGLALPYYATFTSPIRRGPDLLNHLFLGELIEKGTDTELLKSMRPLLKDISANLSLKQQEADNFEIEVDYLLLKEFAHTFENVQLTAKIDFIMSDKMYIKTSNNLTGVIDLDKNYVLDVSSNTLRDTVRDAEYNVGDEIITKIAFFDAKKRNINFKLLGKDLKEKKKIKKK